MSKLTALAAAAALLGGLTVAASPAAASLGLSYTVAPAGPGQYQYNFSLTLTNATGWTAGDQYDWIVFGDVSSGSSPIADFHNFSTSNSSLVLTNSFGAHNGPTIQFGPSVLLPGWQPSGVGDSLTWSGLSANLVSSGLGFSVLQATNGSEINFAAAQAVVPSAVPEPGTWALLLLGFGGIGLAMRRRRASAASVLQAA